MDFAQLVKELSIKYQNELNQDFHFSKKIIDSTGHSNIDLVDFVNFSTIITMCIKYESFTSEVMFSFKKRDVDYNRPWTYTRFILKKLQIDNLREYSEAHDVWEYYNALKHENAKSKITQLKFVNKYSIKNSWDALKFVHESLINILKKLCEAKL